MGDQPLLAGRQDAWRERVGLELRPDSAAGGDPGRGRLALVKPGLPATAFGGKGLTKASAAAPVPPCVGRMEKSLHGAGAQIKSRKDITRKSRPPAPRQPLLPETRVLIGGQFVPSTMKTRPVELASRIGRIF
jgi:hypothetical protein